MVSWQVSELNWRVPSQPCHQCRPVSAYGLPGCPRVTQHEPQVQGTLIVGQPEHPPPQGDGSSAVPELIPLPPNTASHCPQPAPTAVPSLGCHKSATRLCPAAACGSPWAAAVWGGGGQRGDGSSSHLTSRHRQRPRCRPAPVLSPVSPRGPGVGPAPSQRPRLAAGGAGSAGFQQKPAGTRNGPAGRGSIWAELTVAQPEAAGTRHQQHGEPHTPHSAPRTHRGQHLPGFLMPNEAQAVPGQLVLLQGPCFGAVPSPS